LNCLYKAEPSLHEVDFEWQGFKWIDFHDADNSVVAFLRCAPDPDNHLVVVCNFTPPFPHRLPHRRAASVLYREVLNTDDAKYGGSGITNAPGGSDAGALAESTCYIETTLPPLGVAIFKPER